MYFSLFMQNAGTLSDSIGEHGKREISNTEIFDRVRQTKPKGPFIILYGELSFLTREKKLIFFYGDNVKPGFPWRDIMPVSLQLYLHPVGTKRITYKVHIHLIPCFISRIFI